MGTPTQLLPLVGILGTNVDAASVRRDPIISAQEAIYGRHCGVPLKHTPLIDFGMSRRRRKRP